MAHHPNNQVTSGSNLSSRKPELSKLKNHKISSSVFAGKSPSDYESAWSPTSPFDFRLFSSLGNPFGGSSPRSRHQKSWGSGKVGLSIVDSLDDHHTDSSRILPPSPDSKNIIFGSWIRTLNPKCQKHHQDKDACQVINQTSGSLNEHIETSEDYTCVISHGPNPKTIHFYGDRVLESVECNRMKKLCCENKKESIFVIEPLDLTEITDVLPSDDLLSFCGFCSKKLGMGKDLYMYRGYTAFCSSECRSEEIHLNGEMEEEEDDEAVAKSGLYSDKDMFKSDGLIFTMAMG